MKRNRKKKKVPRTPFVSPAQSSFETWDGNGSAESEASTLSVLSTIFSCFKLPKVFSSQRAGRPDPTDNVREV